MHKFVEVSIAGKSNDIEARRETELILVRLPFVATTLENRTRYRKFTENKLPMKRSASNELKNL